MELKIVETKDISKEDILALIKSQEGSLTQSPTKLYTNLLNSYSLITAWDDDELVGLGNIVIEDAQEVYYPYLLVLPDYRNLDIEQMIMQKLKNKYADYLKEKQLEKKEENVARV